MVWDPDLDWRAGHPHDAGHRLAGAGQAGAVFVGLFRSLLGIERLCGLERRGMHSTGRERIRAVPGARGSAHAVVGRATLRRNGPGPQRTVEISIRYRVLAILRAVADGDGGILGDRSA